MPIHCSLPICPISDDDFASIDRTVMACCYASQNTLGRLCDERVYENDVAARLHASGIADAHTQTPVTLTHDGFVKTYRLDLIVNQMLYEFKTAAAFVPEHEAQAIHYAALTATDRVKLLNFRSSRLEGRLLRTPFARVDRRRFTINQTRWRALSDKCGALFTKPRNLKLMKRLLPLLCLSSTLLAADRPNVLLICVDDLKPTLGCFGDSHARTPHMDRLAGRGVAFRRAGHDSGELRSYSDIQATGPLTPEQARTMVHGYYASTAFVDAQVGVVLDALDRLDLWKNTVVVLWGDHGWHLGDHGIWCKHTNFEQAAHNPLIIAAPGKTAGKPSDALVQTVDLYPTLCALAGIEPPAGLPGKSLVPILDDVSRKVHDAVFHVYPRGTTGGPGLGRAARTERYRYVEWRAWKSGEVAGRELYDCQTDSAETENLVGRPEHAALVKDLAARIAALGPAKRPVAKDPTLIEPAGAN